MIYVFDSSPFIVLFRHYYPTRFPSLWDKFNALVNEKRIVSTREVLNEIKVREDRLLDWASTHRDLFPQPTVGQLEFVTEIFEITHFQTLIRKKERLQGTPVADPFVIGINGWEPRREDSLRRPQHLDRNKKLKQFDRIIMNPPFSLQNWGHSDFAGGDPYERFGFGMPPATNGDFAWLEHVRKKTEKEKS